MFYKLFVIPLIRTIRFIHYSVVIFVNQKYQGSCVDIFPIFSEVSATINSISYMKNVFEFIAYIPFIFLCIILIFQVFCIKYFCTDDVQADGVGNEDVINPHLLHKEASATEYFMLLWFFVTSQITFICVALEHEWLVFFL